MHMNKSEQQLEGQGNQNEVEKYALQQYRSEVSLFDSNLPEIAAKDLNLPA